MSNIEFSVIYYPISEEMDRCFNEPNLEIKVDDLEKNINFTWDISSEFFCPDISYLNNLEIWKSIRKSFDDNSKSKDHHGGGNAFWYCRYMNSCLLLNYCISGNGGDSTFSINIPKTIAIPILDEIINVCDYAKQNKQYPNSIINPV